MKFKMLALSLLTVGLIACSGSPNTNTPANKDISTEALQQTPGLEDCVLYRFQREQYDHSLNIVRCSGVETTSVNQTVSQGKTTRQLTTIIIDGKEYVEKVPNGR